MTDAAALRARFPNPGDGAYVCIEIRDTGDGMDAETQRHVFEPFFTTRDRATSTGLGLSVVYGIVTSHKGFIDIVSAPGNGTAVTLFFPVESRAAASLDMPSETLIAQHGGKETILVVEDEEMLRSLVREILTRAGYDVMEAVDGEDGVNVYREHHRRIQLVLLDYGLPKLAGDEVFAELRRIRPDVRAVFSTGYVKKEKTDQLIALGALGVVHKPFTVTEMLATIRRVLDGGTV